MTLPTTKKGRRDDAPKTLSDVLYAEPRSLLGEQDWVVIVQYIAAGDQLALRTLFERTNRIVFTLILRVLNDRQTAEEVTLDVFHDVWRRASAYDPADGPVLGWIMNQARSRAIDRVRFEHRKKRVDPRLEMPPLLDSGEKEPEEAFDAAAEAQLVRDALNDLTANERRAIELAFFSGSTHIEVSELLNQPLGTIKTRIRSALAKLRRALAEGVKNHGR